jgi:hypothetical protein
MAPPGKRMANLERGRNLFSVCQPVTSVKSLA